MQAALPEPVKRRFEAVLRASGWGGLIACDGADQCLCDAFQGFVVNRNGEQP